MDNDSGKMPLIIVHYVFFILFMTLFTLTALLTCLLSLLAMAAANAWLTERIAIAGSFIGLSLSYNTGISFGIRLPPVLQELLIAAAWIGVCVLAWRSERVPLLMIGYGMIVGGALGNIIDRVIDGRVTDFIQVSTFPIFNVADSFITIGVLCVLAQMVRMRARTPS
jgi:signal peptidase II